MGYIKFLWAYLLWIRNNIVGFLRFLYNFRVHYYILGLFIAIIPSYFKIHWLIQASGLVLGLLIMAYPIYEGERG